MRVQPGQTHNNVMIWQTTEMFTFVQVCSLHGSLLCDAVSAVESALAGAPLSHVGWRPSNETLGHIRVTLNGTHPKLDRQHLQLTLLRAVHDAGVEDGELAVDVVG